MTEEIMPGKSLEKVNRTLYREVEVAREEIVALKAENKELKECVEWYARFACTTEINHDYGKRARKLLGLSIEDV
jgi:hypothetical protein